MMYRYYAALITICLLSGCREKISQAIFLIPDHFIGNVIIIYNQPNGKSDSIVDNKVVYKIPKNGILHLKGEEHVQVLELMSYYYYDTKGNKNRICDWMHEIPRNCKAFIYANRSEWYGQTSDPDQRVYSVICVGNKDSIPPSFDPAKFNFVEI